MASRHNNLRILYTSGYTEIANIDQSAFGEDAELLQKPYRKVELARKIRQAIDQAQS